MTASDRGEYARRIIAASIPLLNDFLKDLSRLFLLLALATRSQQNRVKVSIDFGDTLGGLQQLLDLRPVDLRAVSCDECLSQLISQHRVIGVALLGPSKCSNLIFAALQLAIQKS